MYPRIWKDKVNEGWWFRYWHPGDRQWTEDGPFKTFDEANDAVWAELEELGVEMEGVL